MLVPLTDSTNPYAAMMLELIRTQQVRVASAQRTPQIAPTAPSRSGLRARIERLRVRRSQGPAASVA